MDSSVMIEVLSIRQTLNLFVAAAFLILMTYIRPFNLPNQLKRQMSELPNSWESCKMNVWHSFGIRIKGLSKCTRNEMKWKEKQIETEWKQSDKQTKWLNYFD